MFEQEDATLIIIMTDSTESVIEDKDALHSRRSEARNRCNTNQLFEQVPESVTEDTGASIDIGLLPNEYLNLS